MTTRPDSPESPAELLHAVREQQATVEAGLVRVLEHAVAWAGMHHPDALDPHRPAWTEQPVAVAGAGAPRVGEFCVPELAVALGRSHESATRLLGDALELVHRLPRTWARCRAGEVAVWRARLIAQATRGLSFEAAGFVDTHAAPVAHALGGAALDRLCGKAFATFDPDAAAQAAREAAERRCVEVDLTRPVHGTVAITGVLDLADAKDLDHALAHGAAELARLGSTDTLDVRRATALGGLARTQTALDLDDPDADPGQPKPVAPARQVVLHLHVDPDGQVAALEGVGAVTAEQVRTWCGATATAVTIKPVVDLNRSDAVDVHDPPAWMREQVEVRDATCIFPLCTVSARRCDLDHLDEYVSPDDGGPPGQTHPENLAPECRRHHRLKTHGGWTVKRIAPGTYTWTSPHGYTATSHPEHRRP